MKFKKADNVFSRQASEQKCVLFDNISIHIASSNQVRSYPAPSNNSASQQGVKAGRLQVIFPPTTHF
jgi:hypothetical protein